METRKWPKLFPALTQEQQAISNDFMKYWHETLAGHSRYSAIEKFNHGYVVANAPKYFSRTLEIGAGLGEHIKYEKLSIEQKKNYVALELRENMVEKIKTQHPGITTYVGDCQQKLPFSDDYFERILAIHVLEHLPNLPAAIQEMHRLCNKEKGVFSIVIPCEGGSLYTFARKISAQRLFEKRYHQSYGWFIEREHINKPQEIFDELSRYFCVQHRRFFPFFIPIVGLNLCIGVTLRPRHQ